MRDDLLQSFIDETRAYTVQILDMDAFPVSMVMERIEYKASYIENFLFSISCPDIRQARYKFNSAIDKLINGL